MTDAEPQPTPADAPSEAAEQPLPLLKLRDPLPDVTDTAAGLAQVAERIAAGSGPVAIDAERASGYRYSGRAYLVQLRREGSGTALVDPIDLDDVAPLVAALEGTEWILHAATQDLPCLGELGLRPDALFDTELAGRLLGYPRVGLATLVEEVLGFHLLKEHSAADWSTRPLPTSWLEYAALDVEVLVELRAALAEQLVSAEKDEYARQEFDHLRSFELAVRVDAWRRTSGIHRLRDRRGVAAVKLLWEARDRIAAERDVTPSRIIPDSAIVAAATALPTNRSALRGTQGFHGRGASRYTSEWLAALDEARHLPDEELPRRSGTGDGVPPPRAWADRDPEAAARLSAARAAVSALSEDMSIPVENLLTPDTLRRVLWNPPPARDADDLDAQVRERLAAAAARPWQIDLTAPLITTAILDAAADA